MIEDRNWSQREKGETMSGIVSKKVKTSESDESDLDKSAYFFTLYCNYRDSVGEVEHASALRCLIEYVDSLLDGFVKRCHRKREIALDAKQDVLVCFLEKLMQGFSDDLERNGFDELEKEFWRVYVRLSNREKYMCHCHSDVDFPVEDFIGSFETHRHVENRIFLNELKGIVESSVLGRVRFSGLVGEACGYILACFLGERRIVEYHLRRRYGLKNPRFYIDYVEVLLRDSLYDVRSRQYHVGRKICWIENVYG